MTDITQISNAELLKDLADSKADIAICELGLSAGIEEYSGGSVRERLAINQAIVVAIEAELRRRMIQAGIDKMANEIF